MMSYKGNNMKYYALDTASFHKQYEDCYTYPGIRRLTMNPTEALDWFLTQQVEGDKNDYNWVSDNHLRPTVQLFGEGIEEAIKQAQKSICFGYDVRKDFIYKELPDHSVIYMGYNKNEVSSDGYRYYQFYRFRSLNSSEIDMICSQFFDLKNKLKKLTYTFFDIINPTDIIKDVPCGFYNI